MYILAKCNYSTKTMGYAEPMSINVNKVTAYNIEPYNVAGIKHLLYTRQREKKRRYRKKGEHAAHHRECLSAREEQEFEVECTRLFCSFCLKTNYDIIIS